MESVAPPLKLIGAVKRSIEKGETIRLGILSYIKCSDDDFVPHVTTWMALLQQGQDPNLSLKTLQSLHRKTLLQVLERGLRGESIYNILLQLEEETIEACQDEISDKLARLPFILIIPLLLFQFPAFLLLLFGPLLQNFFHSFGGQ